MTVAARIVEVLVESDDLIDPKDYVLNRERPEKIDVVGRRWFRRGAGGTYHVADIYVNGELVHTTEMQYGYGDQYLESATKWLEHEGYIPDRPRGNGSNAPGWYWIRETLKIPLTYIAYDVKRQKDL